MSDSALLKIDELRKGYESRKGFFSVSKRKVFALNGVTFEIFPGETLGLVGESGCGKTTLARTVLLLLAHDGGTIRFDGKPVSIHMSAHDLKAYRRSVQVIFQDPFASLNPRINVEGTISEGIKVHHLAKGKEVRERTVELMRMAGLSEALLRAYPHEMSGGQRQRVCIARALSVSPRLVIADEPVSALDLSIQAQIINLFIELQEKLKLSYLFISHDLRVVTYVSHRVAVMYLGFMIELAPSMELYNNPQHPYTQALLNSVPGLTLSLHDGAEPIKGDVPSPYNLPKGCPFEPRCPIKKEICSREMPAWREVRPSHWAACHMV
ncbi:MAG: ABC transporter ATP-binding protein [Nitrospirae bacterium]|nr:ABC transporter ATP-binding protein [Nitrospirota bacterium]